MTVYKNLNLKKDEYMINKKSINTRLILRNDDLSNWIESDKILLNGEAALARLYGTDNFLMRIGTGDKTWNQLGTSNIILQSESISGITDLIDNTETNTIFQIVSVELNNDETGSSFQLQSKEKDSDIWNDVFGSRFNIPEFDPSILQNSISDISSNLNIVSSDLIVLNNQFDDLIENTLPNYYQEKGNYISSVYAENAELSDLLVKQSTVDTTISNKLHELEYEKILNSNEKIDSIYQVDGQISVNTSLIEIQKNQVINLTSDLTSIDNKISSLQDISSSHDNRISIVEDILTNDISSRISSLETGTTLLSNRVTDTENSLIILNGDKNVDGSVDQKIHDGLAGLVNAMHLLGAIDELDGKTDFEAITDYIIDNDIEPVNGDVIIIVPSAKEYLFYNNVWVELGDETNYASKTSLSIEKQERKDDDQYLSGQISVLNNNLSNYALSNDVKTLSTSLSTALSTEILRAKGIENRLIADIDNKIFIDNLSINALSIKHASMVEFRNALSANEILSNELYVVSSDTANMFGERVTNVAEPELSSDAATKNYVDAQTSSILLSANNYTDIEMTNASENILLSAALAANNYTDAEISSLPVPVDRAGSWLVVDKNGKGDFTTITAALNEVANIHAVTPNQQVYIFIIPSSSYAEDITVSRFTGLIGTGRSNINGKVTVTGEGVWFIGIGFYDSNNTTREHIIHINNAVGGNVELINCYLQDTVSKNLASATIFYDNSSTPLIIRNTESYTKNHNNGSNAKNICIKAINTTRSGTIIITNSELKVSSGSGVAKNEYPIWADGNVSIEFHNVSINQVHDQVPHFFLNNNARLLWMDSSFNNSSTVEYNTSDTWEIVNEGNTPNAIYWYSKEVGNFKAHYDAVFEKNIIVRSGNNTQNIDANGIKNVSTDITYNWPDNPENSTIATKSDINQLIEPITSSFQNWTSDVIPINNIATISLSSGLYPKLVLTDDVTLSVDSTSFPVNGTSVFKLSLSAGEHVVELDETNVVYLEPMKINQDGWTTIYFERSGDDKWIASSWSDSSQDNILLSANEYTDTEISSLNSQIQSDISDNRISAITAANDYTNEQLGIVYTDIKDPFQQFTSELSVIEDVVTIKRSSGMFPYAYISSDASIVIDSSSFPNNGIPVGGTSSVKFSLSVDSNELTFGQVDVEYIEPFEIQENSWNTIYFEKTGSGNWKAITW